MSAASVARWTGALVLALAWGGCAGELPDGFTLATAGTTGDGGAAEGQVQTAATAASPMSADAAPACPDVPTAVLLADCATAGCHGSAAKSEQLDLQSAGVYARLSGARAVEGSGMLIDPADPASSVLYTKLLATPPFGSRMPLGAALDDATIACVLSWIAAGDGAGTVDAGVAGDAGEMQTTSADAGPRVTCPTSAPSSVGPYIVQCPAAAAPSAATSEGVTFAQPPVAGDLEVALVAESQGQAEQVTPPAGQGWSEDASCEAVRAGSNGIRFFSRTVGANEAAASFVFSSSVPSGLAVALYEIASPGSTPVIDGCVAALDPASSGSATTTTKTVSAAGANELALAAGLSSLSSQAAAPTVASGWSVDTWSTKDDQYISFATAHDLAAPSAGGAVTTSFTFSAATVFQQSVLVLFK